MNIQPHRIFQRTIADVELVLVAVDELETLFGISQSYASLGLLIALGLAVSAYEDQYFVAGVYLDVDEGGMLVTDPMFERIFHEGDEKQWWHLPVAVMASPLGGHLHLVGESQFHQCDIVVEKIDFLLQGHVPFVALVKHITHDTRQLKHCLLGLLGVDVYQRMDIVEGVHEEMGTDLVRQVDQLLFQVFPAYGLHLPFLALRLEIELHTEVHADDHDHHQKCQHIVLPK